MICFNKACLSRAGSFPKKAARVCYRSNPRAAFYFCVIYSTFVLYFMAEIQFYMANLEHNDESLICKKDDVPE
jgi:hypothetical protein